MENTMNNRHNIEQAIANDLTVCEIGMALTKGKLRKRYAAHRKNCVAQIAAWNEADGLNTMTDDELLSELLA